MMHQKLNFLLKLRRKSKFRYISYGIPLACVMLSFICSCFIHNHTFAALKTECSAASGYTTTLAGETSPTDECGKSQVPILTEPGTASVSPTASLTIDNQTGNISDSITAQYGATNYSSHTVKVEASDIASYTLTLSGPATLSGPSTINATAGAKGSALANDTWGYAWETTSVTDTNANYKALSNNITLTGDDVVNNSVNFSRKLAFAVKFQNAQAGTYHADISLSLVVTPKAAVTLDYVSWDRLVYMQDMNPTACTQAPLGTPKTLTDIRDNSTYTIAKLTDGRCWMTQNLRLSRETMKTKLYNYLNPLDTNIIDYYAMPVSTDGAFSNTQSNDYYTNQQIRASVDDDYGAYYSYNAATANGAATQSTGRVEQDICPKNWQLPSSNGDGSFNNLFNLYPKNTGPINPDTNSNGKNGFWLGASSSATGGALFIHAGSVGDTKGLSNVGSYGVYWPGTVYSSAGTYALRLDANYIYTSTGIARYIGASIRCIAK